MSKQDTSFQLEGSIGFHLGRTTRQLVNRLNRTLAEKGFDFHREHLIILVNLWRKDGANQQELSDRMCRDKTITTRLLDHLEKLSLVVRVPDQNDRRNKLIYLTHEGKQLQSQLFPIISGIFTEIQDGIPEEDMATCKRVLTMLYDNLTQGKAPCQQPKDN